MLPLLLAAALAAPAVHADTIALGSRSGIWTVGVDGAHLRRLTRQWDEEPTWSRDGSRIAFTRVRGGGTSGEIWVMNADGSDAHRVTRDRTSSTNPTWSPAGDELAYEHDTSAADGTVGIYVIRADGGRPRRLASSRAYDFTPAWSPDGRTILFERGFGSAYLVDVRTRRLTRVGRGQVSNPAWSRDGATIAFDATVTVKGNPRTGIFLMNADGSRRRLVRYGFGQPSFSPDGKRLAVTRILPGGKGGFYVTGVEQGSPLRFVVSLPYAEGPSWRPAG